ncbi:40S ribosomal protein S21-like [Lemur catta]|uniref:40S ribosomal protein S21-like n=1 Tax=Lemur catta TaxID=9447 RepID=UPI001E2686C6|nr:40S ribosomal protein S21-like [Lemur catta]
MRKLDVLHQNDLEGNPENRESNTKKYKRRIPSISYAKFVALYLLQKCSASNRILCAKDHTPIQMNAAKGGKVMGRVHSQFKACAICGAIRRMGESHDSILPLAKANSIISKNF